MKTVIFVVGLCAIFQVLEGYTIIQKGYRKVNKDDYLIVKTTKGPVSGFLAKSCRKEVTFAGFRGIPYAEPPVGNLRFRDPVEKSNWTEVYDATFQRPGCMQGSFDNVQLDESKNVYNEDCLYLNVYTPNVEYLKDSKKPLKSVMVFVHGGAFIMGSSYEDITAPDFLVEQDVVLVTMNYRLGVFGFMSLQNADVPGNAGLKDQNLALKWVKNNIRAFGGNPEKITIFGESAGAASVHYQMLSKSSSGLFNGVIMESGTVISSWAYSSPETVLQRVKKLASQVKCKKSKQVSDLLTCLQKVPAKMLAEAQKQVLSLQDLTAMDIVPFQPTKEPNLPGAFITENPVDVLLSGNFTKVPTILGINSNEGLLVYSALKNNALSSLLLTMLGMDLSRLAPPQFNLKPRSTTATKVHQAIAKHYFKNKLINENQLMNVLQLIGDVNFVLPTQVTARVLADHSPSSIYNYHFDYDGGYAVYKAAGQMEDVPGVSHADELGYLFYTPGFHKNCADNYEASPEDELTLDRMTQMWTNFAKTGNPTPEVGDVVSVKWLPVTSKTDNYLNIDRNLTVATGLKKDTMTFWEEISKIIGHKGFTSDDSDEFVPFSVDW